MFEILVNNANILSEPLCKIYCASMDTGVVPEDWRRANVSAVFKKGTKAAAGNCRPVSLTSHVSKILEAIIEDNIVDHLRKFQLIERSQHGFIRNRSCLTNLLEYLEFVSSHIDIGIPVDVLCLDFPKAFDKVPR